MVRLFEENTGYPNRRQKALPCGIPRVVSVAAPPAAQFDEFVIVKVVASINLPEIRPNNVGQAVTVCNISGSPHVYVGAADALIDNLYTKVCAPEYVAKVFVAAAPGLWLCVNSTAGRWDDIHFPTAGVSPPGAASDPSRDTTSGLLEFSKSATNTITGVAQLPHSWVAGSEIRPHIHHRAKTDPAGTGDVVWKLEYKWYNNGDTVPASYTSETKTFTLSDFSVGLQVADVDSFTAISSSSMRDSSLFEWKLSRLGADASDTYDDVDVLVEFDIHVLIEAHGSWDEYPGA